MQLGPGAIVVGILVGAIAIYLYIEHSNEVTAVQQVSMAQQRCDNAKFSVRYDRALSSGSLDAKLRLEAAENRAIELCNGAARERGVEKSQLGIDERNDQHIQSAAGQTFGGQ